MQPVVLLQDVADNTILSGPESTIAVTASLTPDSPDVFLAPASRLVRAVSDSTCLSSCWFPLQYFVDTLRYHRRNLVKSNSEIYSFHREQ